MKRLIDILGSVIGLVVFSPVLIVLVLLVRKDMGSPVLFSQMRPGLNGQPFKMLKFRSMKDAVNANGEPLPDAQRLTPLGRKLRASSADELPGLLNVLTGKMSLVGPRPLLMEYLPLYSPQQSRRHDVRPGLTGWAQVNGRNSLTWDQKFELDVWYVDNRSLWLDIKIIFLTIKKVLVREGISAQGEATAAKFTGSL